MLALANGNLPTALILLGSVVLVLALEWFSTWLLSRTGTALDPATSRELIAALRSAPSRVPLLDRETDDLLRVTPRRILGEQNWRVERYADGRRIMEEVEEDFAAGRGVSTIPYTSYLVDKRQISAFDGAWAVCIGDGGTPEPYELPGRSHWFRDAWLRLRTGAARVEKQAVTDLTDQLRRAEPIHDEPEDEHAAA